MGQTQKWPPRLPLTCHWPGLGRVASPKCSGGLEGGPNCPPKTKGKGWIPVFGTSVPWSSIHSETIYSALLGI